MDSIWAPWRMEFIEDKRQKEGGAPCVFCELAESPPNDKNLVLVHGETTYIVMNRFPYTNGHLMVVPYSHTADLKELPPKTHEEILRLTAKSLDILSSLLHAEGFNCGMNVGRVAGGGIVDHFHWHIVPRWSGDHNFLPVLSKTRVMPQYLSETYERLQGDFKKLSK